MKTFEEYQYRFSIPHNKANLRHKYSPKTKEELVEAIEAEIELQGPEANLNCIDTSGITDMANLFNSFPHRYAKNFNGDISGWDVSNVKDMRSMFGGTKSFNQDISNWDVSNVINMSYMFCNTKTFNQDISNWDVSKVKDMANMFWHAESFNQDISSWDISSVLNMEHMFWQAKSFNQDISGWDVSSVKDIAWMFDDCPIKEEYKPKFD